MLIFLCSVLWIIVCLFVSFFWPLCCLSFFNKKWVYRLPLCYLQIFLLTQRVMTLAKTQQIHPQIPPNSLKHSTEAQPIIILTLTKGDL